MAGLGERLGALVAEGGAVLVGSCPGCGGVGVGGVSNECGHEHVCRACAEVKCEARAPCTERGCGKAWECYVVEMVLRKPRLEEGRGEAGALRFFSGRFDTGLPGLGVRLASPTMRRLTDEEVSGVGAEERAKEEAGKEAQRRSGWAKHRQRYDFEVDAEREERRMKEKGERVVHPWTLQDPQAGKYGTRFDAQRDQGSVMGSFWVLSKAAAEGEGSLVVVPVEESYRFRRSNTDPTTRMTMDEAMAAMQKHEDLDVNRRRRARLAGHGKAARGEAGAGGSLSSRFARFGGAGVDDGHGERLPLGELGSTKGALAGPGFGARGPRREGGGEADEDDEGMTRYAAGELEDEDVFHVGLSSGDEEEEGRGHKGRRGRGHVDDGEEEEADFDDVRSDDDEEIAGMELEMEEAQEKLGNVVAPEIMKARMAEKATAALSEDEMSGASDESDFDDGEAGAKGEKAAYEAKAKTVIGNLVGKSALEEEDELLGVAGFDEDGDEDEEDLDDIEDDDLDFLKEARLPGRLGTGARVPLSAEEAEAQRQADLAIAAAGGGGGGAGGAAPPYAGAYPPQTPAASVGFAGTGKRGRDGGVRLNANAGFSPTVGAEVDGEDGAKRQRLAMTPTTATPSGGAGDLVTELTAEALKAFLVAHGGSCPSTDLMRAAKHLCREAGARKTYTGLVTQVATVFKVDGVLHLKLKA